MQPDSARPSDHTDRSVGVARGGQVRVGSVVLAGHDDPQSQREKLARIVMDAMYQFVGLLDAQGMTLEINRAALEGAGLDLDAIRGKPFWEARWFQVSRESVGLQREFVARARAGEFIRCDLEVYGEAAGDRTIVVDFSLQPVFDADGQVAFLVAEGRNITEKKKLKPRLSAKTPSCKACSKRSASWISSKVICLPTSAMSCARRWR